ncbi:MAG: DUF4416 family protein [Candidatus Omnitrophota bacterium]|nr:DUF4416 family protein [Candidatus Omnitrophota bacterium]
MGKIQEEIPVKLIVGFIFSKQEILKKSFRSLIKKFGKIDFESERLIFNYSTYYEKEFGEDLKRKFISFNKLILPSRLAKTKKFCNSLELKLSEKGKRQINIDPGYISASKLVLATTKDFAHRIYLSMGIFAELTLNFRGNSFAACEWTYPDYKTQEYIQIFNQIRLNYLRQLKENNV